MYLDPQAQAIADQLAHLPRPDFSTLSVADYRAMLAAFPMPSDGEDGLASITDHQMSYPASVFKGLSPREAVEIDGVIYQVRSTRAVGDGSEMRAQLTRV